MSGRIEYRPVRASDLQALLTLEARCFDTDRLSRRSFRHWIALDDRVFLLAMSGETLLGYILIIHHRGTRLARIYSLAVDNKWRGRGIAQELIRLGEAGAAASGRFYVRLEVACDNQAAIALYQKLGYRPFGVYHDYYDDHGDALRMHKRIRHYRLGVQHTPMPWMQQTTTFTCGPASLMMAMGALSADYAPSLHEELQIWREATTIFMTSGHGGTHPLGLAIAARHRGFTVRVFINQSGPLFVDGVRDTVKKQVVEYVHEDFLQQADRLGIEICYEDITQQALVQAIEAGQVPIVLISTWRLDRKKAPHWVAVSGYDAECLYVHDPSPDKDTQSAIDCQYLPIAREDFERMSYFGRNRLRTAILIGR